MRTYNTGKSIWTYGQIIEWHANRTAARWLLGPCPKCGNSTSNYGSSYSCNDMHCRNSANVFVTSPIDPTPEWWAQDIDVKLDGNSWCATYPDFINLQESKAGFGDTPSVAVENLLSEDNQRKDLFKVEKAAREYSLHFNYVEGSKEFEASFGAFIAGVSYGKKTN